MYSSIVASSLIRELDLWHQVLRKLGVPTTQVHSFLPQEERTKNLNNFKEGKFNILLTTDLSSRGLDIRTVGLVINFDFPQNYVDYVHRAGRTARGLQRGKCLSLVTQTDLPFLKSVEEKVSMGIQVCNYDEEEVLKGMRKVEKIRVKAKINNLVKAKTDRYRKIKKQKREFQEAVSKKLAVENQAKEIN